MTTADPSRLRGCFAPDQCRSIRSLVADELTASLAGDPSLATVRDLREELRQMFDVLDRLGWDLDSDAVAMLSLEDMRWVGGLLARRRAEHVDAINSVESNLDRARSGDRGAFYPGASLADMEASARDETAVDRQAIASVDELLEALPPEVLAA